MRIRTRLTVLTAMLMALTLGFGGAVLYARFASGLREAVDAGLRSRAQTLLAGLEGSSVDFGEGSGLIEGEEAFAQVLSADGEILDTTEALTDPLLAPDEVASLEGPRIFEARVPTREETIHARLLATPSDNGLVVVVGANLEDQRTALGRLSTLLWFGVPIAVALATSVGWWLAGAALRPIERMRTEASAISASDLERRLPVAATGDEVARLGETLNALLERLAHSLERERRFVDDASHELRTPLATLKAELELALREGRSSEELRAALMSAAEDADRLTRLAEDLLVLARSERGLLPVRLEPVDLGSLAGEVVSSFEPRAGAAGISLELEGETGSCRVDAARLRQVLSNLIDNAIRHTPSGGSIVVRTERADGRALISVSDSGEGFPPAFLEHAFEPFTRSDSGRGREGGGTGLGLAIVKAIVDSHRGEVRAGNRATGGAEVSVDLPAETE